MTSGLHPLTTQKLRAFARRRRVLLVARGVCAAGATFLGAMTLVALLDRFVVMPDWLRLALSILAYAAVVLVVAWTSLRPLIRRNKHGELAKLFGEAFPELGDDIISAVELGDPTSDASFDSPAFRAVLQQSVASRVAPVRMSLLLPWRLIAGWGLAAVGLAVVVAVLSAIPNMHFGHLMARALAPTVNLARVSDTRIHLIQPERPEQAVPRGDPLAIVVEIVGHDSPPVTLRIRRGSEGDAEIKMDAASQAGQFTASLDVGPEPLSFRIEADDAATKWYTVNGRSRPEAVKFDKTYEYPAYAKLPAKRVVEESGDLAALEGSRAAVVIETDQPVKEARLRIEAGDKPQDVAMTAAQPDGKHWSASIPLTVAGTYQIHFVAAETGFENKMSPQYELRPIPDLRPSAEITRPTTDARAEADATLDLRGAAHDDLALAGVVQMIRVNQGPWREVPLVKDGDAEAVIHRAWNLKELGLHNGDEVTTKLVATDRKGNTGESEPVKIVIGSAADAAEQTDTKKIADAVKALATAADQIHDQTAAATKDAGQDVKENKAKAAALAEKQDALDRGVAELRNQLKQDANKQDLLTPDGRELARDDDDAAAMLKQPTPAAGELLRQAEAKPDAAAQKASMQSAANKQKELAAALHELAKHFESAQAGKPEEDRAALRQAEAKAGIKSTLDIQYGQLQKLADMTKMSPEELKPALQAELPKNPAMQGELSQIAKNAVEEAQSDLDQAAADEKHTADDLAKTDAPSDAASDAAKQPQIAAALQHAADNEARAAQDANRLGQQDAAKALQDLADQTRQVAKSDVPAAQQALENKSPSEAQPAVQKAAAAIGEQAKKLDAAAKSASKNPSSPNGQRPPSPAQSADNNSPPSNQSSQDDKPKQSDAAPKGQSADAGPNQQNPPSSDPSAQNGKQPPSQSPSGENNKNDSSPSNQSSQSDKPNQSDAAPKGQSASPASNQQNGTPQPSSPSDTAAAQPAEAASKWMAAALDHLDQAVQNSTAGAAQQPSQQAGQTGTGEQPSAPNGQTPEQAAAATQAENQAANQPGNQAVGQSSQSGDQSENQSAGQSGQQPNAALPSGKAAAAQNGATAAQAAIRSAVDAQAQAMRDTRMSDAASSDQSKSNGTGNSSSNAANTDGSHDVVGTAVDKNSQGNSNWGKLSPQAARDLMESNRENIPVEYRQQVEAYFRAIAEKTKRQNQP